MKLRAAPWKKSSGPIVAIALVLCAVFVPTAFIVGLSGQFYKQFALTIAISTVISAFNSLTLSPALAALLLKSHDAKKDRFTRAIDFALAGFSSCSTGSLPCIGRVWKARHSHAAVECNCCCGLCRALLG